jgi:hypothetical protein
VYVAPVGTSYPDPTKLNGTDPAAPWVDLGIVMNSQVQLAYTKETKYVETGIEKVRRGAYITQKTANAQFTLEQYDMGVLEAISGIASTSITGGKKMTVGLDDLVEKMMLFVGTNKFDGKEYHHLAKRGVITWNAQQNDDYRVIQVSAELYLDDTDGFFKLFVLD